MGTVWQGSVRAQYGHSRGTVGAKELCHERGWQKLTNNFFYRPYQERG